MFNSRSIGSRGEAIAAKYLIKNGYKIIEQNFRTKTGEIDIVAKEGGSLVFVEVKYRASDAFGLPGQSIGRAKQKRITKAALGYIMKNRIKDLDMRFDAVLIGPRENEIELIKSAFFVSKSNV